MAPIGRFRANRLVSARTGIPSADRSGQIIGTAISQSAGQAVGALAKIAEEQRAVADTLDVMERGTTYENEVRDIAQQVKQNNLDSPNAAFGELKARLNQQATAHFSPNDTGRRTIAMKRVIDGYDQGAVSDLSKWAVNRNNQIINEKFTGVLNNSVVSLREDVKLGANVDALDGQLLKMAAVDSTLGTAKQALVSIMKLTDPSASAAKIDTMVQNKMITAYTNAQLQTNPGLLLAEIRQGKFDKYPGYEEQRELRAEAETAFINKTKEDELDTAQVGTTMLLGILKEAYDISIPSPNGDLQSLTESERAATVQLVNAERKRLLIADQGPTQALANVDSEIEMIKKTQGSLRNMRETFLKNSYFKIEPDVMLEALHLTGIERILGNITDDPDKKYAADLFQLTSTIIEDYNKGKISKATYTTIMTDALPALQNAVNDGLTGFKFKGKSRGFRESLGQIQTAVDNFISDDESSLDRNNILVSSSLKFWEEYSDQIANGAELRPEQFRALGQDAFVKALIEHGKIPSSDLYLIENSDKEQYTLIDKASQRSIVITKTGGLYNIALRGMGRKPEPAKQVREVITPTPVDFGKEIKPLPGVPTAGFPSRVIDVSPKRAPAKEPVVKPGEKLGKIPGAPTPGFPESLIDVTPKKVEPAKVVPPRKAGRITMKDIDANNPEENSLIGQVTAEELLQFRADRTGGMSFNDALKKISNTRQKNRK